MGWARRAGLWVVVAAGVLVAAQGAHADDASKRAKVQEYFQLTHTEQLTEQIMAQVTEQMQAGVRDGMSGIALSPEQQGIVDDMMGQVLRIVQGAVGWKAMEPEYERLFAAAYTEQQLDDLLAFYRTPSGQALVAKTPELMRQASTVAQDRMTAAMPEVQKVMRDGMEKATAATPKPKPTT